MSQSYLYTMNENPAVEWNKLGNGSSLEHHFSTLPVITRCINYCNYTYGNTNVLIKMNTVYFVDPRFDFSFIVAPVIIFKPDTIVCGSAAEVNCMTDLELMINLNQMRLISTLCSKFECLLSPDTADESSVFESPNSSRQITMPSTNPRSIYPIRQSTVESETDFAKDSGIDFEISSMNSTNLEKPMLQETPALPPFEFLINCGKVTVIVYDMEKATSEDHDVNFFYWG